MKKALLILSTFSLILSNLHASEDLPNFHCKTANGSREAQDVSIEFTHDRIGREAYYIRSSNAEIMQFISAATTTVEINNADAFHINWVKTSFIENPLRKVMIKLEMNNKTGEGKFIKSKREFPGMKYKSYYTLTFKECSKQ